LLYKIAFHKDPNLIFLIYLNCVPASPPCCGPAPPSARAADPAAQIAGACSTRLTDSALRSCQQLPESQGRASAVMVPLSQELNNPVTSRNRLLSDAGKLLREPSLPTSTYTQGRRLETQGCQPSSALTGWGCEPEGADTFQ